MTGLKTVGIARYGLSSSEYDEVAKKLVQIPQAVTRKASADLPPAIKIYRTGHFVK